MRILFVLAFYDPYIGGIERVFKALAEGLVERGHHVRVLTAHLQGTAYFETINGVEVERVPVPKLAERYFFTFLALPATLRRASEYDLIHTSTYNGAPPAFLAARMRGRPVLLTAHEVLGQRWHLVEASLMKAWIYRLFEWIVVRLPYDRFVAVSKATLKDALSAGVSAARASYIYNGVDGVYGGIQSSLHTMREKIGASKYDFIYLYYGRPGKTKGVHRLISAAVEVQKRVPNSRLVLIMSREPRPWFDHLFQLIESLNGRAQIDLLPPFVERSMLFETLLEANCIVVPSLTEGFGLTTAEACALGIPVVATRAGSIPEVISGRHVLVEPDSSAAIAEGVVRISQGNWDETPVKTFTWDAMVTAYEGLYREMLA